MSKLQVYTDGSCSGNPGSGGWACIIIDEDNYKVYGYHGKEQMTTNNRMELRGLLAALSHAERHEKDSFEIISDSAYCTQMCREWIYSWANNGWRTAAKKPVQNIDLVQAIYQYLTDFPNFSIRRCEGHAGVVGNELADALATGNMKRFQFLLDYNNFALDWLEEEDEV